MGARATGRTHVHAFLTGLALGVLVLQLLWSPFFSGPGEHPGAPVVDPPLFERPPPLGWDDVPPGWRAGRGSDPRPNLLLIVTDDQTTDMMEAMPLTRAWLVEDGVTFTHAYATTPVCCPSRASLLTGLYAHNHGVRVNEDPLNEPTMVEVLHEEGYFTGLSGKYLNSWNGTPRPEFDRWTSFARGWAGYESPLLNVDGEWVRYRGYITNALRASALSFLQEAKERQQPFLLLFTPNAPHAQAVPAPGDAHRWDHVPLPGQPALGEEDLQDKPQWLQDLPRLTPEELDRERDFFHRQLASLASVDRAIDELMRFLEAGGLLNDTLVVFTSDNGMMHGQHHLTDKGLAYEPSVRVPLAMRGPDLPQGRVVDELVANIDIPATFLQAAGTEPPWTFDGRAILPLLDGTGDERDALLLEGWPRSSPPWKAVHTGRYVYIETQDDRPELYDLTEDPHQLESVQDDPGYQTLREQLEAQLEALRPGW